MGRRILFDDERGFVWHETYPDESGARSVYDALDVYYGVWIDGGTEDAYVDWDDQESADSWQARKEADLAQLGEYLKYVADCAMNLVESFDLHMWRRIGEPTDCLVGVAAAATSDLRIVSVA